MKKRISMQQIADQLNISKMTVSKAINSPKTVSAQLRDNIIAKATEMGYDFTKAKTSSFRKYNFAFIVKKDYTNDNEDFYTKIYAYLSDICILSGSMLSMFIINDENEQNNVLPITLESAKYDGIFVAGQVSNEYLKMLVGLELPVIAIDFYNDETICDCILSDNYYMGYIATSFLIHEGHQEIGFLTQPTSSSIQDRFYGYQKALSENGLQYNPNFTISNFDIHTKLHTSYITLPNNLPSAFVCNCDMAAYYLTLTLKANGYRLPKDISLISFDDTSIAIKSEPNFTTFNIDKAAFAKNAFETMLARMQNKQALFKRIYVPVHLKIRDSVSKRY